MSRCFPCCTAAACAFPRRSRSMCGRRRCRAGRRCCGWSARARRSGWCRCCRWCARRSAPGCATIPAPRRTAPLFTGARGARLNPGVAQRTMRALPPPQRPARARHAACAAALLRHPPAGRRRRSAGDPGPAGPCQPVHHATLYLGGRGRAAGGVAADASAGVKASKARALPWTRQGAVAPWNPFLK